MSKTRTPTLPKLRSTLVEVLARASTPSQLVVAAADAISLDARVDDWFVHHLKLHGTEAEVLSVLDTTDRCTDECSQVWRAYENGQASYADVLVVVLAAKDALARILPQGVGP